MSVKPLFILVLLGAAFGAKAQRADTALKGSTIEIIQSYKPKVKQSPKPEWIPQLPPADTSHTAINYDVPQQTLYYTYNSLPLRPLELGKNMDAVPFKNYVKVGGGNLSTVFLDAGIGSLYGKDYETAIHLHHMSQQSQVKYQQSSLSGIEAEGVLHKKSNDLHAMIMGERNQYNYYGYNHNLYDLPGDSVRQTYTTVRAVVDLKNKPDSNGKFVYNPAINASVYTARVHAMEVSAGINAPFTYKMDTSLDFQVGLAGQYANYKNDSVSINNTYAAVTPGIVLHHGPMSGHALVGLALGINGNGYILPDILCGYRIPGSPVLINLGWLASLRQNTYEQLSTENPYLYNSYSLLQTRRDEVFANLESGIGDHLTISGRASWWSYNGLPTYLNDYGDQKQFRIIYEDVKAISLQVAVRCHVADIWSVGATGDFYSFYNISDQYVWHEPSMRLKGDFIVNPTPKLTATAYLAMLGGVHARDLTGQIVNLNVFAELGANAEYQIIPRLSVFVQLNNLLNNKYQRWYGYEAYGLNIYGGLRLKF